jgi:hypothetical protein
MRFTKYCLAWVVMLQLVACDMLGLDTPAKQRALSEADGMAVGAACRHAGRAIEDCYVLNPTANRAAVFNGWKEMNDYMTKNKIEIVKPQALPPDSTTTASKALAGPGAHLPSLVFEPPAKTAPAAKFTPPAPDSMKKDIPTEKKPSGTPTPSSPSPAAQQKSVAKDSRVMANVDNATALRAKEQAHTPGSPAP